MDNDEELSKAFSYATYLLSMRAYTEKKINQKLKEKGFKKNSIATVILKLIEYRYLNDEEYAHSFIKNCQNRLKSKRYTYFKLLERGISAQLAGDSIEHCYPDEIESQILEQNFEKAHINDKNREKWEKKAFRQGFQSKYIKDLLSKWKDLVEKTL